jgi:hypothetical protein
MILTTTGVRSFDGGMAGTPAGMAGTPESAS